MTISRFFSEYYKSLLGLNDLKFVCSARDTILDFVGIPAYDCMVSSTINYWARSDDGRFEFLCLDDRFGLSLYSSVNWKLDREETNFLLATSRSKLVSDMAISRLKFSVLWIACFILSLP